MISEADLRDWDYDKLRTSVTETHYGGRKESEEYLRDFIEHIEALSKSNMRQIAALLRAKEQA